MHSPGAAAWPCWGSEGKRKGRVTFFPVCFSTMSLLREKSSDCGVLEHPPLGIVLPCLLDLHLCCHRLVVNRLFKERSRENRRFTKGWSGGETTVRTLPAGAGHAAVLDSPAQGSGPSPELGRLCRRFWL